MAVQIFRGNSKGPEEMIHEILWRGAGGVIGMVKSVMGCQQQADCLGWKSQSQKDGESTYSNEVIVIVTTV